MLFTTPLSAILFLFVFRGAFPEKESRSFWVAAALALGGSAFFLIPDHFAPTL
jgi:hypothetical protein